MGRARPGLVEVQPGTVTRPDLHRFDRRDRSVLSHCGGKRIGLRFELPGKLNDRSVIRALGFDRVGDLADQSDSRFLHGGDSGYGVPEGGEVGHESPYKMVECGDDLV